MAHTGHMTRRDVLRMTAGMIPAVSASSAVRGETLSGGNDLAGRYIRIVRDMLDHIRATQSAKLLEGSHAIARTVMHGGTVWHNWDTGHSTTFDLLPGREGVPELLTPGFDPDAVRDGDCFLASKRSAHPVLAERDVFVIGTASPWSRDAKGAEDIVLESAMGRIRPYADVFIENGITTRGAVVDIPGSPAPVGPVSGIVGLVTLWMMLTDACRILAREGYAVPVRGAGPAPEHNSGIHNLDAPLMDDWYARFMREYELIGAERGTIRRAADMAADSVLGGGRVWCWGRDWEGLPFEATTRRGGLTLLKGIYPAEDGTITARGETFAPSPRDTVIMGIYSPHNAIDLDALDTFRRYGMNVISIGPMIRGGTIPAGRTIPGGTDIHLGRMSDTYGLFALPGFPRPVCPTSGATLMQIFWTLCLETADRITVRTGDIPGVYLSGALRGGLDHLARVNAVFRERGY